MKKEYSENELFDTLQELSLKYKNKRTEIELHNCPFCEQDRHKRSDHFSFKRETGQFNCVKCGESGNLITFRRKMGIDPFEVPKIYRKPPETVKKYAEQPPEYYASYEEARGIPPDILKEYSIGKHNHPEIGMCRTYPYMDLQGEVVNVKYVNSKKEMRQEKDTRKNYFGLQHIDFTKDYLHVVEGEDDCMALRAMGFDNVVSVPNGAGSYKEEMGKTNANFKKIYLLFDNDKTGEDGAEKFAYKAGLWKCYRVDLPFKDARECLLNGIGRDGVEQLKIKSRQYEYKPEDRCRPALSIDERILRYERECREQPQGIRFGIPLIDSITGGLRQDVFGIIANPGCFKTTALINLLSRSKIENGMAIFFSFEMGIEQAFEREATMSTGHRAYDLRKHAMKGGEQWRDLRKKISNTMGHVYVSEESHSSVNEMKKIIEVTEEASGLPCKLIGIDYLDFVRADTKTEYDAVRMTMNAFKCEIARGMRIPCIVLAQTNRQSGESDVEVKMRSGKGGTGIESACDFEIGLWNKDDDVVGRFLKHRRIDSFNGGPNPYFRLEIDKETYRVDDFIPTPKEQLDSW